MCDNIGEASELMDGQDRTVLRLIADLQICRFAGEGRSYLVIKK